MNPNGEYSRRKALLIAKADLERLKLRHALREIQHSLHPPDAPTAKWVSPAASTIMALALPALGLQKIRNLVQMVSAGLLAYRFFNQWRQGQ
jgi:hypothetical protein